MSNQYIIVFPSLEKLCGFKLAIEPKAYSIDVSKKTLKCFCSKEELENAIRIYGGNPMAAPTLVATY